MVLIKKFTPLDSRISQDAKVGLKDPISFVVGELGPFEPNFLQQGRRVSLIPTTINWARLSYDQAVRQATNTIYIVNDSTNESIPDKITETASPGKIPSILRIATNSDIQSEIDKVKTARDAKLQQFSSLSALRITTTSDSTSIDLSTTTSISPFIALKEMRLATKGEVLQQDGQLITNLFLTSSNNLQQSSYTKGYKVVEGTLIEVDSLAPFTTSGANSYITLVAVGASSDLDLKSSFANTQKQIISPQKTSFPRKILFFKVKELISPQAPNQKPRIRLEKTDFSPAQIIPWTTSTSGTTSSGIVYQPGTYIWNEDNTQPIPVASMEPYLFSLKEIQLINSCQMGSFIAVAGYPILSKRSVLPTIPSLESYLTLIQAEIPKTKLFSPVNLGGVPVVNELEKNEIAQSESARFVGNLDRKSLRVVIHDNDSPVILVDQGEAQQGCAIDYKLYTQADANNNIEYGDVQVTIRLEASPTRVPILGQPPSGSEGVQLNVDLKPSQRQTRNEDGTQTNTQGEYVFSRVQRARGSNQKVSTSYGVLRTFDKVRIVTQDNRGTIVELGKVSIARVDVDNNIVFFTSKLKFAVPSNAFLEIPQSPLNPGRTYRVEVSCSDRIAAAEKGIPVYPNEGA